VAVALLLVGAGTAGTLVAVASSDLADPGREPGAWTAPDREQLAALRDAAMTRDHLGDFGLVGELAGASTYQAEVLADGKLSFGEYQVAADAWVTCLSAQGIKVPPARPDGLGRFNKEVLVFPSADTGKAAQSSMRQCSSEYTDAIDLVWASTTEELTKAVVSAARAATAACFSSAGYGATDRPWQSGNEDVQRAFSSCAREVSLELDVAEQFGMDGDGLSRR
jgi:hypothetical protein